MSDRLVQAFLNLFNFNGMVAFIGGVLATLFIFWLDDRRRDRVYPQNKPHRTRFKSILLLWLMVYLVVGYIAVQEQTQANKIEALNHCNAEFLKVSKIRQDAGDQTDEWSRIKTKAMNDWLKEVIVNPPEEMLQRRMKDPNDPIYIRWAISTTVHYETIIDQAEQQQEASLADRRAHPLPELTCGQK